MKNYLSLAKKFFNEIENTASNMLLLKNPTLLSKKVNEKIQREFSDSFENVTVMNTIDFFKNAQNQDILYNYLEYLFICNLTNIPYKTPLFDQIKIYYLKTINKHYQKMNNIETLDALDKFLKSMYDIATENFGDNLLMEFFYSDNYFKERIQSYADTKENIILKLLQIEHVPKRIEFEMIKTNYNKIMKQINSSGFIYLLGEYKFNEFYISPILLPITRTEYIRKLTNNQIDEFRHNWEYLFQENNIAYVIGGAGYGKSLFLKNLANNYNKLKFIDSENYLVIYCDLKSYFYTDYSKKTIIDFITESLIQNSLVEGITNDFVAYYISIGRCIFLFDALDEVPKDKRAAFHDKIIAFIECKNPSNKACITSRDKGFLPKQEIKVNHIIPLTKKDINDYLDKMIRLKKFKNNDKELFMNQADDLIKKGFLNNFLILSLLVNIFKSEQTLPQNKIELYKKCFEFIAKKREEEKSKIGYDWGKIFPLMKDNTFIKLANLAAPNNKNIQKEKIEKLLLEQYSKKYTSESEAEYAISQFLEFCSNRTELFVPSSVDDEFKFFHRSFFEYFYSQYIVQKNTACEMYDAFNQFDVDSEVFELTTALLKETHEEKYQDLVDIMFQQINCADDVTKAFCILSLAMQVIDDKCYIRDYLNIFIEKFNEFDENIMLVDQALLARLLQNAVQLFPEKRSYLEKCITGSFVKYHLGNNFFNFNQLKTEENLFTINNRFIHSSKLTDQKTPFFVTYFKNADNMSKVFERSIKDKDCMDKIFNSETGKNKRQMKRAIKYYNQLSIDKKSLYWKLFTNNDPVI